MVVCSWTELVLRWQVDDSRCWRLFLSISSFTVPPPRELRCECWLLTLQTVLEKAVTFVWVRADGFAERRDAEGLARMRYSICPWAGEVMWSFGARWSTLGRGVCFHR